MRVKNVTDSVITISKLNIASASDAALLTRDTSLYPGDEIVIYDFIAQTSVSLRSLINEGVLTIVNDEQPLNPPTLGVQGYIEPSVGAQSTTDLSDVGGSVNTANGLVKLEADGKLPALDGSSLTNLPGGGGGGGGGGGEFNITYTGTLSSPLTLVPDIGVVFIPSGTASGSVLYSTAPGSTAIRGLSLDEPLSAPSGPSYRLQTLSLDNITAITGPLTLFRLDDLQSFSAPSLRAVVTDPSLTDRGTLNGSDLYPTLPLSTSGAASKFSFSFLPSLTTLNLPVLKAIESLFVYIGGSLGLTTVSLPSLETVKGHFKIEDSPNISTINLPSLKSVWSFIVHGCNQVTSVSLPSLTNGAVSVIGQAVTSINLPSLLDISPTPSQKILYSGLEFNFAFLRAINCPALTSLSAPNLAMVDGVITISNCPQLSSLDLSSLTKASSGISISNTGLTSLSFPGLGDGSVAISNNPSLASISFSGFTNTTGTVSITENSSLLSISFPVFSSFSGAAVLGISYNSSITSLSFPSLKIAGETGIANNSSLTSVSFSAMESWYVLSLVGNPNLTDVSIGTIGTLKSVSSGYLNLSGNALYKASVDVALALMVSLDGTNGTTLFTGTLDLSGGANSAPSATGLLDKATLIGRGASVLTN